MGNQPNASERLVEMALRQMQKEGSIIHFIHARRHEQLDSAGIDFIIFFGRGLCISLQVKSRHSGVGKHEKKYPHIEAVIVVKIGEELEEVKKRLGKLVNKYIARLRPA